MRFDLGSHKGAIGSAVFAAAIFSGSACWAPLAMAQQPEAYTPCTVVPRATSGAVNPFAQHFVPYAVGPTQMLRAANLCYGNSALDWREKRYGSPVTDPFVPDNVRLDRRFEMYRPGAPTELRQKVPLVIYAHPNGASERMAGLDGLAPTEYFEKRVLQAVNNGFAFMSVQFRHPRASLPDLPGGPPPSEPFAIPNTDIATAVQWARSRADGLGIDAENIFLLGQSRGSLTVLTALMDDQRSTAPGLPDYRRESSKPRAVFGVQAQTSYRHDQLRDLFAMRYASTAASAEIWNLKPQFSECFIGGKGSLFDYHCHFDKADPTFAISGSALMALDRGDPPIWLRYDRDPTDPATVVPIGIAIAKKGADQSKGDCFEPPSRTGSCFDVHHANFGLALTQAFRALTQTIGQTASVTAQYGGTFSMEEASEQFYDNYYCFFIEHLTEAGNMLRKNARNTADCKLNANEPWPVSRPNRSEPVRP
jgi:hypothetical protein